MSHRHSLIALFRKEFLELIRDYRTLLFLTLTPLIMMPLMGFVMTSLQHIEYPKVEIIIEDDSIGVLGNNTFTSSYIADLLRNLLTQRGVITYVNTSVSSVDLRIVIPRGFTHNLTSLDSQAFLLAYQVPGSSKAEKAYSEAISVINDLSRYFSDLKIKYLAEEAGVTNVSPEAIRNPATIYVAGFIAPSGAGISPEEAWKIFIARLFAFSMLFVSTPATTYIIDSILGEKERKTLEILLSSPIKRRDLILGKVFASSIIGLLAAAVDVLSIIIFFIILSTSLGYGIMMIVDKGLLIVTGVVVYLTTLATLSLTLPVIIRSSTMRSAQVISSIITIASSLIFISVLFVDFYSLPKDVLYPLLILPYTNSVLAVQYYAFGDIGMTFAHITILLLFSVALMIISSRLINEEKMLLKPV